MYSNDYSQIKNGFVNYLGACIQALPESMSAQAKSHFITSELAKQITTMAIKDDGNINLFVFKPVFRSVIYALNKEINRMKNDRPYTQDTINSYKSIINVFQNIIDHTEDTVNG